MKRIHIFTDRRVLSILDQGLSSLTNLLISVLVAHTVSASEFGVYAIVTSIYWLGLGGQRAAIGEPLLILREELWPKDSSVDARAAGLSVIFSVALAVPLLAFAADPLLRPIAFLALVLPALLWQDVLRYVFFARRQPIYALFADVVWLIAEVFLGAIILLEKQSSIDVWVAVWGISALISVVATTAVTKVTPKIRGSLKWARNSSRISKQMLADFMVLSGTTQLIVFCIPLVSTLTVLGAMKAAQVAAGPLQVGLNAASVIAIPAVASLSMKGRFDLAARRGMQLSGLVFLIGCLYTLALVAVPTSWGEVLFGESWVKGGQIAGYVGLQYALIGVIQGALVVLRGTRNTRRSLIVRVCLTPGNAILPLVGAAVGGAKGLGISLVVTTVVGVIVWWLVVWRSIRAAMHPPVKPSQSLNPAQ